LETAFVVDGLVAGALVATGVPPRSATDWLAHIVLGSAGEYQRQGLSTLFEDVLRRTGPDLRWAVVTRGADGADARGPHAGDAIHVPGMDVDVVDSTGAGDAFTAGFLHGVITDHDVTAAATLGCAWGAAAARLPQSVPPRWDELGLGDPNGEWTQKLA
jgi:sugar/nucleoside kinase (ribokinase family)